MRLLTVLCVAALVVAFAVPASAETQNIKVSGDIKAAYVYQRDISFQQKKTDVASSNPNYVENENFFMQQIGLNVEADLTDNVSTYIRLINERDWNANYQAATTLTDKAFDILLDEAYVTLKEMLYAPLTVKIGRQNIWLGKGFVIGNSGNWGAGQLPGTISEYSDMTAFDAIRATLDYDPWTVDLIYSKIGDGSAAVFSNRDDVDLYVANVGYDFTKYDAEAEAYYVFAHDKTNKDTQGQGKPSTIHTIGLRGSLVPFESMNLWAEGALQYGRDRSGAVGDDRKREAYALDLGIDYTFADVKWTPKVGAEWIYLSGNKNDGKQKGWHRLFRGKFDNYIADFRGITKGQAADVAMTNEQSIALFGAISPMTDITLDGKWTYLWHDQKLASEESKKVGWEVDGKVAYDYTEDVQFSCAIGYFKPDKVYTAPDNKAATQVVAGVAVDF
jgi:hypothetical protein